MCVTMSRILKPGGWYEKAVNHRGSRRRLHVGFRAGARTQDAAPKVHSMTGCLRVGLRQTAICCPISKRVRRQWGSWSSANLAPHVGHGSRLPVAVPANAEADANVPKAPHYMKVDSIKMISTTCPKFFTNFTSGMHGRRVSRRFFPFMLFCPTILRPSSLASFVRELTFWRSWQIRFPEPS